MTDNAWLFDLRTPLEDTLGFELLQATPEAVVGRMPVAGHTQPFGAFNGGMSAYLAETLGSLAGMVAAGPRGAAMGTDLNVTHHAPARSGYVTGTARPLRVGRTIANYEVVMTNEAGDRIATARLTVYLRRETDA